ncbi:hypothetical protein DL93DRAFT_2087368 [Clavulina sp. PMI_390]|nr:hypothetical protein DL93DRAFT_2087368 [Clavulina sp. PMI_390]
MLLIHSVIGVPWQSISVCVAWKKTLTHLMIDRAASPPHDDSGMELPNLPKLRLLATRDPILLATVTHFNALIHAVHLLDAPWLCKWWNTSNLLIDALLRASETAAIPRSVSFPVLCRATFCFSITEVEHQSSSELLQRLSSVYPALEHLTIHVGCDDYRPSQAMGQAEYLVDELSICILLLTLVTPKPQDIATSDS